MDKRQVKSQQRLMRALADLLTSGKKLDQVSIKAIVNQAQVARSTFYRNFDSKDDFLDWVISEIETGILEAVQMEHGEIVEEPFKNYFRYLYQQREFIKAFVSYLNWPFLTEKMFLTATNLYEKELRGKQTIISATDLANYIVGAHVQVSRAWLMTADPRSPEKMATVLTTLTRDNLLKGFGIERLISLPK
ncbi:TetR/AcrR family transcriptional regulator [Enterococcus hermanniensis]|uniref:TetR/AcrR family transcriptional regulator n=1 Tax=Enterococcus hermanniensis TaxID=249189 RepID=UPI000ACA9262|nr:TetR/AcrR family transcriptional regulator [Enterococcus hermanniensis]